MRSVRRKYLGTMNDKVCEPVPNEPVPHQCKQNIVNNTYEVHNDQYTLNIYNGYEVSETEVFGDNKIP